jgi:histidine triad (HIT) family protein
MDDSIFTKIIKGEIPCEKVYEDEKTFAFLDLHPFTQGHVLVVPKTQVDKFYDLPPDDYEALWGTVQLIARRLEEVIRPRRVCIRAEGFDVPHAHIHVYSCNTAQDFHGLPDRLQKLPDHRALAKMAKKLAF